VTSAQPSRAGGYINPNPPGFSEGRTDQGVDYSGKVGEQIKAPGDIKVLGISQNWYKGQPFMWYEITSGDKKGQVDYIAEQFTPNVKPGETRQEGQVLGTYAPSGTGIEEGFATRSGQTLAMATTGYREGEATRAGQAYRHFLEELRNQPHELVAVHHGAPVVKFKGGPHAGQSIYMGGR
jgi:hypothetical protein